MYILLLLLGQQRTELIEKNKKKTKDKKTFYFRQLKMVRDWNIAHTKICNNKKDFFPNYSYKQHCKLKKKIISFISKIYVH